MLRKSIFLFFGYAVVSIHLQAPAHVRIDNDHKLENCCMTGCILGCLAIANCYFKNNDNSFAKNSRLHKNFEIKK